MPATAFFALSLATLARVCHDLGMAWAFSDINGVEDDLEAMGERVWKSWVEQVRPLLLEDPSPTNPNLLIDQTLKDQVWIPGTDVFVVFFADGGYIYLLNVVDLLDEVT